MAKPRYLQDGDYHHIYFRGIDHDAVFFDDRDREYFLDQWRIHARSLGVASLAHSLLSTHAHFFVGARISAVSKLMHRVLGVYATRFNRRWGRCGDLFQSRFRSKAVTHGVHARAVVRYVLLNPVEAGICSLDALATYWWTNLPDLLQNRGNQARSEVLQTLALFASDEEQAGVHLRNWLRADTRGETSSQCCYRICTKHHVSLKELRSYCRTPDAKNARTELATALNDVFGWSSRDIASYLGCSRRTVQRMIRV